jgi:hypothetical protein
MKINSEPLKLREVLKKILKPHGQRDYDLGFAGTHTQGELAKMISVPQWKLSNWKNAADGSEDENNWQWALRLFTYCQEELGFDPRKPENAGGDMRITVDKNREIALKRLAKKLPRRELNILKSITGINLDERANIRGLVDRDNRKQDKGASGSKKRTGNH